MKNKYSFSLILITILASSVLLLGVSYSKSSGVDEEYDNKRFENNNISITYQNDTNSFSKETAFNLVNKNNKYLIYIITITDANKFDSKYNLDDKGYNDFNNNTIYISFLAPYGQKDDYKYHTIAFNKISSYKLDIEPLTNSYFKINDKIYELKDIENDNLKLESENNKVLLKEIFIINGNGTLENPYEVKK